MAKTMRKPKTTRRRSNGIGNNPAIFAQLCRDHGLPEPVQEYRFHPVRRWRFDYAWPDLLVALEVEGGVWTGGRHTRGSGFKGDMEKYNTATVLGWRVLRCVPSDVCTMETVEMITEAASDGKTN